MSVRFYEGSIPWPGQEHREIEDVVCAEQSVDGSQKSTARNDGINPPKKS